MRKLSELEKVFSKKLVEKMHRDVIIEPDPERDDFADTEKVLREVLDSMHLKVVGE